MDMEPPNRTPGSGKPQVPGAKRQRILNACNQCRKRKVRCDEAQPRCRNCFERHEECITTDPRTQEGVGVRRRTNKTSSSAGTISTGVSPAVNGNSQSPTQQSHESWLNSIVTCDVTRNSLQKERQNSSTAGSTPSHRGFQSEPSPVPSSLATRPIQFPDHDEIDHRQYSYNHDMIINQSAHQKRKCIGGGTLQSLSKYLDHYFEYRGLETIGPKFVYGMQHAEEFPQPRLGSSQTISPIPQSPEREIYLQAFFDRIHPMFPVLDIASFRFGVEKLATQDLAMLHQEEVPLLASAYCVFSLGADETAGCCTEVGSIYLTAAYNLWAYIVSVPYLPSVQALLLLTVALKSRNRDGCGGQSLAQAIRIAQSLGLNHANIAKMEIIPGESVSVIDSNIDAYCWWVCYCLEQMFGLEIGRPILIREVHCHQIIPRSKDRSGDFFALWASLSQIQNRLYEALYARPSETRNAADLLRDIGEIDRDLCDWAAGVEPEEIRPTLDLLCAPKDLHFATFLAANYFQTLITVHQASLLVDPNTYKAKVELLCLNSPSRPRLRSSEVILINSARKIADLLLRQIDQKANSRILGPTTSMIALMILGCHIMKDAGERRNRADLELLTALSKYAEVQYRDSGQHPKFIEAITILQQQIQREVHSREANPVTSPRMPVQRGLINDLSDGSILGGFGVGNVQHDWAYSIAGHMGDWNDVFGDFILDDPWSFLQDSSGIDVMMGH